MVIGVDVSKDSLSVGTPQKLGVSIPNSAEAISQLLMRLEPESTIAMEATGKYHKILADIAFHQGFRVLVFNPKDTHHYRRSISPRASTDPLDARCIARFALARDHRPYTPASGMIQKLKALVGTRSSLVRERVSHENRLRECPESNSYLASTIQGIKTSIKNLDKELVRTAKGFSRYRRLLTAPGFGPLVSASLLSILAGGDFRSSDSFVAFIGLDLRIKESGKKKGKACLSKRGDPEVRRLLYLAAMAACRCDPQFKQLYLRYVARGFSKTQALVAVARKLARVAWAIYTKDQDYRADRVLNQPTPQKKETLAPSISEPIAQTPVVDGSSFEMRLWRERLREVCIDPAITTLIEKENSLIAKNYLDIST